MKIAQIDRPAAPSISRSQSRKLRFSRPARIRPTVDFRSLDIRSTPGPDRGARPRQFGCHASREGPELAVERLTHHLYRGVGPV